MQSAEAKFYDKIDSAESRDFKMHYSPWRSSATPQTWRIPGPRQSSDIHAFVVMPLLATVVCLLTTESQNKALEPFGAQGLSPSRGWHQIPNTQLASLCPADPSIEGNSGCRTIISAWNGGVADTKRDRLIIWGGGHNAYYGNEVYALDLSHMVMLRLTEPSPVTNVMSCPEEYADGRPSARHTYGGVEYFPEQYKNLFYCGRKSSCRFMSGGARERDLAKTDLENRKPQSPQKTPANTRHTAAHQS